MQVSIVTSIKQHSCVTTPAKVVETKTETKHTRVSVTQHVALYIELLSVFQDASKQNISLISTFLPITSFIP